MYDPSKVLDGTPEKRLFLSIIADYDLRTGLCELIDNSIDHWIDNGRKAGILIDVQLDVARQIIKVTDNAGGVREDDLEQLIAPGASRANSTEEMIGIFGVGGKRAGIALGERVEIRTRFAKKPSFGIDVTSDWLGHDDWNLPYFDVSALPPGTTSTRISEIRKPFDDDDVALLRNHLSETYSSFILNGCKLRLDGKDIIPRRFDTWAYPDEFKPRRVRFNIEPAPKSKLSVSIEAGLIVDRDPEADNYGVYIYCNDRLIAKELKTREVGYVGREAGVPHPDASLCRAIVRLNGPAEVMPWNSSKSGLNLNHPAFALIQSQLIQLVTYFSTISRRTKSSWDEDIFPYRRGSVRDEAPEISASGHRIVLPDLPRARPPSYLDELQEKNANALKKKPWLRGVIEGAGFIDLISRSKLRTKNRAAMIILDSNLEIAIKEYIVNNTELYPQRQYGDSALSTLLKNRKKALQTVAQNLSVLNPERIAKLVHYYEIRERLSFSRITPSVSDGEISEYRALVDLIVKAMFSVRFPKK